MAGPSTPSRPGNSGANPFDTPIRNTIRILSHTSAAFLVSSSPIRSENAAPPRFIPMAISPQFNRSTYARLLDTTPSTVHKQELQQALKEMSCDMAQKGRLVSMQGSLVLANVYCDRLHEQLAAQDEHEKKKVKGRLVGDGLPRLLTATDFVTRVSDFHKAAVQKAAETTQKKASWAERAEAMKEWKRLDDERKERNKVIKDGYHHDVRLWEAERDQARLEKRRPGWNKPSMKGLLLSPIPKPKLTAGDHEPGASGDDGSDSSSSDSDGED
ncbi:hypothetical protein FPV67DRAFT_1426358 [Lyophyllum atratum]|nr:hypothetical protein FPV67DRAFT_1426358 [Lyophyllum atratum]